MLPRLFYNNFRRLKLYPLPNCSLNVHRGQEIALIQHPILFQQNVVNFSLSGPVTTKKTELFKETENKFASNSAGDDRDEQLYSKTRNNPDTIGSRDDVKFKETADVGDFVEEKLIENPVSNGKRLSTKEYADMIKEHLSNNRVKEAIDVLEIRMMQEDRAKPDSYIFDLLIEECAAVGNFKKAFNLFAKMKERGLKLTGRTYSSLFNACAAIPWPEEGLKQATRLQESMLKKGYEPNASIYNSMIKAFGRCGDIGTAFQLVDEMKSKKLDIQVNTFNFLLQACISDAEFGFRHALIVWHKMYQRRLLPDLYSFNLLLRCVRDCSIGDIETMQQVISDILLGSKTESTEGSEARTTELNEIVDQQPNLITRFPRLGSLVQLKEVKKAADRLLLLGGVKGILNEMEEIKVQPDIKTFTLTLDVIPSTNTAERQIIETVRKQKLKYDIDFYNVLIKKRSMRQDYEGAKSVLEMIESADLDTNMVTYGMLALGCQTVDDARDLLGEMDSKGIRMNMPILEAMLKQGCYRRDFPYVIGIMNITRKEGLKPDKEFLQHLHNFNHHCQNVLKSPARNKKRRTEFEADFENFKLQFKKWNQVLGLDQQLDEAVKTVKEHPWQQFQKVEAEGLEDIKKSKIETKNKTKPTRKTAVTQ